MRFFTTLILIVFVLLNTITINGQTVDKRSKIVMSEADITSLIQTLKKYKKVKNKSVKNQHSNKVSKLENNYNTEYLSQRIAQLEKQSNTVDVFKYNNAEVYYKIYAMQKEINELQTKINDIKLNSETTNSEKPISTNNSTDKIIYLDSYNQPNTKEAYGQIDQEKDFKIRALENKIFLLESLLDNQKATTTKNDDIKIVYAEKPNKEQQTTAQQIVKPTNSEEKITKITAPSKTINEQQPNVSNAYIDSIQNQIAALKNAISTKDTVTTVKELSKKYDTSASTYANYRKQLFFKNNKKELDLNQVNILDEIVSILANNDNIDVFIKGFASNKGNPVYNENLSLQRTESVKKILVAKGVHPTRILTQYHGIDYKSKSDDLARRVDIDLLIRK